MHARATQNETQNVMNPGAGVVNGVRILPGARPDVDLSDRSESAQGFASGFGPMSLADFRAFRELIHGSTGIWLRDGKQVMLASRLARRLRHHALGSYSEYYRYVSGAPDDGREMRELINCVTTNKTSFFREDHHFRFLAEQLVPELRRTANQAADQGGNQGGQKSMRIWSAACSTGEEPYSIVIALREALGAECPQWKLEVIASDIDTGVLARAKTGVYDAGALDPVRETDPALIPRCFLRGKGAAEGKVQVKHQIMQHVTFRQINLMAPAWPLEGRFDAIFFRNALIYFQQPTQEQFLRRMLGYLRPGGYLLLGHSEHVPWLYDAVVPLPKTVYRLRS
jgi:chemotaxis protein methyltransferase CheR